MHNLTKWVPISLNRYLFPIYPAAFSPSFWLARSIFLSDHSVSVSGPHPNGRDAGLSRVLQGLISVRKVQAKRQNDRSKQRKPFKPNISGWGKAYFAAAMPVLWPAGEHCLGAWSWPVCALPDECHALLRW